MKRGLWIAALSGVLCGLASPGLAVPMLRWESSDCDANTCYDFFVTADPADLIPSSFFVEVSFQASMGGDPVDFVQTLANGTTQVDDDVSAFAFENTPGSGYSTDADSFFYLSIWQPGPPYNGVLGGAGGPLYQFSGGTGANSEYVDAILARLVVPSGALIRWGSAVQGEVGFFDNIGRKGETFKLLGQVPEPGTGLLFGLGLLGLGLRGRRSSSWKASG